MYDEIVTKELLDYIKNNIFPVYSLNGKSHDINHINYVLNRAYEISKPYRNEMDMDMLYTAVSYHDIGDHIDRENHEIVSANWMYKDEFLNSFFTQEQRVIIKEAIEDHRSSKNGEPRNIYGKILASADKNIDVDQFFIRAYQYGIEHDKDLSNEQQIQKIYKHAIEKFGKSGYAVNKYYVEDKKYSEYLQELQRLIENEQEFFEKCKKVLNIR